MGLPTPFNPYAPIPNSPFYGVNTWFLQGWQGPLVIGAGLNVDYANSTLNSSGGGGGGAVNQIIAGTGISVSPAGGTGNVIVSNGGVTQLVAGSGIALSGATGSVTITATGGGGTVTSIFAGSGLSSIPNPITTTGTFTLNYACVVDPTDFTGKGVLLAGTNPAGTYTALAAGLDGQVLTACTACANGMYWGAADPTAIPCSAITGKGALITGTTASTPFSLSVGAPGTVLTACPTAPGGLCWAPAGGGVTAATPTVAGTVFGCTLNSGSYNTALGVGTLGTPGGSSAANTAVGPYAMAVSNNALGNTAIGGGSMCTLTDGQFNIGVGYLTLPAVTTGCSNIAVGVNAGSALTTEDFNVILGSHPGVAAKECQIYIADGQGTLRVQINECGAISPDGATYGTAGQVLCSGGAGSTWGWTSAGAGPVPATPTVSGTVLGCTTANITGVGCNAVLSATGAGNTGVGCGALGSVTTGMCNTAVGWESLCSSTGNNNTAMGVRAGRQITTGVDNTALGFWAMGCAGALTGNQNVAVGTTALGCLTSGTGNVSMGYLSSLKITTGSCNVSVGLCALGCGSAGVTGSNNIAIGTNTLPAITSANANIVIGGASHAALATGGCNISIGGQNNVGANNHCLTTLIGNQITSTQSCQVIIGWAGAGTTASFVQGSGSWTFSSDEKQKAQIENLSEGLELIEKLQPRTYDFIGGIQEGEEGTPAFGLIAQEVAAAIEGTTLEGRGLVTQADAEHLGVSYASLTVILINAVKELSARVKELESK